MFGRVDKDGVMSGRKELQHGLYISRRHVWSSLHVTVVLNGIVFFSVTYNRSVNVRTDLTFTSPEQRLPPYKQPLNPTTATSQSLSFLT